MFPYAGKVAHVSVCVGGALVCGAAGGVASFVVSGRAYNASYKKELENSYGAYGDFPRSREFLAIRPILDMLATAGWGVTGMVTFGIAGYYATDRLARTIERQFAEKTCKVC